MYEFEIETKNKLKRIKNPRKARMKDWILFYTLQIMDENGKWITVCNSTISDTEGYIIVQNINEAIKNHETSICVDI